MKPAFQASPRAGRGVTLVELLISVTIGLALTIVIAQLFLGSRQTFATTDEVQRMQENIRFTHMLLTRTVHLAGYKSAPNSVTTTEFSSAAGRAALGALEGSGTDSDTLIIRYQGNGNGTGTGGLANLNNGSDGSVYDCLGEAKDARVILVNTFEVRAGANGRNALFCNNTEMVPEVENMQILFGVDTDGDLVANNFLPLGSVPANQMDSIVSLRVSLMFTSATDTVKAAPEPTRTYDMLGDGSVVLPAWNDRRLRRVVVTTFNLRNRTP